jgi:hypothetical protein
MSAILHEIGRQTQEKPMSGPENVIGRAVQLPRARADRDFTGPVGLGPGDSD